MKTTKKSINDNLYTIHHYRTYATPGAVGIVDKPILTAVYADYDTETGIVTGITDYSDGAMEERHYHERDCVDVTDIILEWMKGEITRNEVVNAIYEEVTKSIN